MAVRVVQSGKRIVVRDNPFPFWLLNLTTVFSAVAVFFLAYHHIQSPLPFLAAVALAEILFGVGLWFLVREPATVCTFDQASDTLTISRWYMIFRTQERYPLRRLRRADVEELVRVDGSRAFRPVVQTREEQIIPLSVFWYTPAEYNRCRTVIDKVNLALIFS